MAVVPTQLKKQKREGGRLKGNFKNKHQRRTTLCIMKVYKNEQDSVKNTKFRETFKYNVTARYQINVIFE